jgi:hypothetical protein
MTHRIAALLPLLLALPAVATTYHVPADFSTIQGAIDSATHGDEIVVATGTYRESLEFKGKNIILRSTDPDDANCVKKTILMPESDFHGNSNETLVILFSGGESSHCTLTGFTITGGKQSIFGQGGAILANHSKATITKNRIQGNSGSLLTNSDGVFSSNIVVENLTVAYGCNGFIENNLFNENLGGLWNCGGKIRHNVFYGNEEYGILECSGKITNNIIWGNGASPADNIVNSSTPSYCCIEGWTGGGVGNIVADPRFVDPENEEFRLLPDSFCIDSGGFVADVTEDIDGSLRPILSTDGSRGDGSGFDIGAYEFTGTVSPNLPPDQPSGISPIDGATDQLPILTLTAASFFDPDGNAHAASQWQIDTDPDFSSPVFDTGPTSLNLVSLTVPSQILRLGTSYSWRVRYQDHSGAWSEWSEPSSFTTLSVEGIVVPEDYSTIQAAIDAATDGDTVTVTPGVYDELLILGGKNIVLTSLDPMNDLIADQTVLKGKVVYSGTETEDCILQGFTLSESDGISNFYRNPLCKPTIQFNKIIDSHSAGIAYCHGLIRRNLILHNSPGLIRCNGVIEENEICSNSDPYGGGLSECDGIIRKNLISDNFGAGVFGTPANPVIVGQGGAFHRCDGLIENNIVVGNEAYEDGPAFYYCTGTIRNNTVVDNPTREGQSVFYLCTGTIRDNIVYQGDEGEIDDPLISLNSSQPRFSLIQGIGEQDFLGNFDLPPLFIDETNRDFHLHPHSPCIDRGGSGVTQDYDGNPRGVDGTSLPGHIDQYDIGAFEYQGPYVQAGDLSGNGSLDAMDLFVFQKGWMGETDASSMTNVNWDEKVDEFDLLILLGEWLR